MLRCIVFAGLVLSCTVSRSADPPRPDRNIARGIQRDWYRDAKFGLFIHWGLYAIPAKGEWYMNHGKVPREEYRSLAGKFNPVKFDADAFALCAKNAGMQYMVITAKHHDGFAMYDSAVSDYDIVDATPFGRDVMKELASACKRHGIRFGFYYSQAQDWDEPNAGGGYFQMLPRRERDMEEYLQRKCYPQVEEIMTQYGDICEIYFDTPGGITNPRAEKLFQIVRKHQPDCQINSRLGGTEAHRWDYISCYDNNIPSTVIDNGFEVPATLAGGWGYTKDNQQCLPREVIVGMLCDIAGMGGNYLLNVGPTEEGIIPPHQVQRLAKVGDWLEVHGDAIYGTSANPFGRIYDWGTMTQKGSTLYMIFWEEPGARFELSGLKTTVQNAWWMHDQSPIAVDKLNGRAGVVLDTSHCNGFDIFPIAVLDLAGKPETDGVNYQQGNGEIQLELVHASDPRTGEPIGNRFCDRASIWLPVHEGLELSWDFTVTKSGVYEVQLVEFAGREIDFKHGERLDPHHIEIQMGDQQFTMKADHGQIKRRRFNEHGIDLVSTGGQVTFDRSGHYTLHAKVTRIGLRNLRLKDPTEPGKRLEANQPRLIMNGLKLVPARGPGQSAVDKART